MNLDDVRQRLRNAAVPYGQGVQSPSITLRPVEVVGRLGFVVFARNAQSFAAGAAVLLLLLLTSGVGRAELSSGTAITALIHAAITLAAFKWVPVYTPKKAMYEGLIGVSSLKLENPDGFLVCVRGLRDVTSNRAINVISKAVYSDSLSD